MDPSVYIPAYLSAPTLRRTPNSPDAARELVHNDVSVNPHKYAQTEHAQALLSYAGVHRHLLDELHRIEDMGSDEEFEQTRNRLFDDMRDELLKIVRADAYVLDAQLLAIILADTPVDACLGDLMKLEATTADYLQQSVPGFDMEAPHYWANKVLADGVTAADLTVSEPTLIGWLHTLEAISQLCMASARYRAAVNYSRRVLKAEGYPTRAAGTVLLALARLEDEDGFCPGPPARGADGADAPRELPGTYSPARSCCSKRTRCARRHARCASLPTAARAARSFAEPHVSDAVPSLPARTARPWDLSHQAVWEADGIISDTPDFAPGPALAKTYRSLPRNLRAAVMAFNDANATTMSFTLGTAS